MSNLVSTQSLRKMFLVPDDAEPCYFLRAAYFVARAREAVLATPHVERFFVRSLEKKLEIAEVRALSTIDQGHRATYNWLYRKDLLNDARGEDRLHDTLQTHRTELLRIAKALRMILPGIFQHVPHEEIEPFFMKTIDYIEDIKQDGPRLLSA